MPKIYQMSFLKSNFKYLKINNRHFFSKGFQPLVLHGQGVETPWKVSIIFNDVLIYRTFKTFKINNYG